MPRRLSATAAQTVTPPYPRARWEFMALLGLECGDFLLSPASLSVKFQACDLKEMFSAPK